MDRYGYFIRINHGHIVAGLFELCGISKESWRAVAHVLTQVHVKPWKHLRAQLVNHLSAAALDQLEAFSQIRGTCLHLIHLIEHYFRGL